MVLTAYVALSPVTGLFCHRRLADIVLSKPGRADATPQNLTPASGRQDHTILPYAAIVSRPRAGDRSRVFRLALQSRRTQNAAASTATHPAFVTIMIRPLWGGMRKVLDVIWGEWEQKYFWENHLRRRAHLSQDAIANGSRAPGAVPAGRGGPHRWRYLASWLCRNGR